jgi:LEA14-like dessication related protein
MKKTIVALIIAILLIINIIGVAFIFIDIQVFKFPQTTVRIDFVEINSNEAIIHHDLRIQNPNSFDLILQNIQILATTSDGVEVARVDINGGTIPGGANRSYSSDDVISLQGNISGLLTSKVTGTVGVNILGIIKKTIPLEITVLTSLHDILQKISLPTITVHAGFGNITGHAINMTADIDVTNPNTFTMTIGTINLDITSEIGKLEGNFTINGTTISAEQTSTLHGQGTILLDALNAKQLLVSITAQVGATIAGINKTLPFSSKIDLTMPPLEDFLTKEKPLELGLDIDFKIAKGGMLGAVTLTIDNPTILPLFADDLFIDYYRIDHGTKTFITQSILKGGEIPPHKLTNFTGQILLPLSSIIKPIEFRKILPDALFARLNVNLSVSGINQSLWVGLGSFVDIKLLRFNT